MNNHPDERRQAQRARLLKDRSVRDGGVGQRRGGRAVSDEKADIQDLHLWITALAEGF